MGRRVEGGRKEGLVKEEMRVRNGKIMSLEGG